VNNDILRNSGNERVGRTGLTKFLARLAICVALMAMTVSAVANDLKVGFVNAVRITAEAPQAEAARAALEREFAERDQELVALQRETSRLEERLQRDAAVMSESEQRELERRVLSGQRELRRMQEEFREDFNIRRNEELSRLQQHIVQTIDDYAEEQGFDLILSDGVVFASERIDITSRILERLAEQHRSGNDR